MHLNSKDNRSVIAKARLGSKACGHPHIVHGGALASLLDDVFGVSFFASKLGGGFTANLTINYRKPLPAGKDVLVMATIDRIEESASGSKKVYLVGKVLDEADQSIVYTEGNALFIVKAIPSHMRTVEKGKAPEPTGSAAQSASKEQLHALNCAVDTPVAAVNARATTFFLSYHSVDGVTIL